MDSEFESCMKEKAEDMDLSKIKSCINKLLFKPEPFQIDKEVMSIVILREKANKFDFLEGFTRWKAIGSWREISPEGEVIREYPEEKNVILEVEYKDVEEETVSPRLQELLNEYNRREVKETLLYTRFQDIEHSSL